MSHRKSKFQAKKVWEPRAGLLSNSCKNLRLLGLCVLAENAGVCAIKTGGGERMGLGSLVEMWGSNKREDSCRRIR